MRVRVDPGRVASNTIGPAVFTVEVYNTDDVIRAYDLQVFGVDPAWCQVNTGDLSLFPGTAGYATIVVDLPGDVPAGEHRLAVEITETTGTDRFELIELVVDRMTDRRIGLELHPPLVTGGRRGGLALVVENSGNAPVDIAPSALDLEDKVTARFDPPRFSLAPREQQIVDVRIAGPRPIVGSPQPRTVVLSIDGLDDIVEATATFVQRPWISRGLVALMGLLTAASVLTLVLANNLGQVIDKAKVDDELLIQAIESEEEKAAIASVPASVAGSVTEATSGQGLAGVTVELYHADNEQVALRSAATDEGGGYEMGGISGGSYKLRFVGAGFTERWYEDAATFDGATSFDVEPGGDVSGLDVVIGGQPGVAAGLVLADDPVGAVATLVLPGSSIDSDTDATVATVNVASDGTFVFEDVPAPAVYRLEIAKPGYARETRTVSMAAAETVDGIEILLGEGDGEVSGTVFGPDGALGGITVTATDGVAVVTTTSLTSGEVGSFTLRDLVTPASYTVTASGTGYRDEVVTIVLDEGQKLDGLAITMAGDTGALSGVARLVGSGPLGGVTVTITDGTFTMFTTTLSTDNVGSWSVSGLPSPGTYTVTFSRDDLVTQTRSVDLDPLDGNRVGGVDASLSPVGAVVQGVVSDENGPVGGVDVALSDGSVSIASRSADTPVGSYEIRDIPPGTYTATFSRPGSAAQTILVTLQAGEVRTIDIEVATRASISGTVRVGSATGPGANGAQVSLYRFDEFPLNPLRTVVTGSDGVYAFADLVAPENYVVEVSPGVDLAGVDSQVLQLGASEQATGTDFVID